MKVKIIEYKITPMGAQIRLEAGKYIDTLFVPLPTEPFTEEALIEILKSHRDVMQLAWERFSVLPSLRYKEIELEEDVLKGHLDG